MAPEVLKCSYSMSCDLWSLGITTYACLTGNFPYTGESVVEMYESIDMINRLEFTDEIK